MLAKKAIRIPPDGTAGSVTEALSHLGADLLMETLPRWIAGEIQAEPQDDSLSTYAPMLKKEEGWLDFTRDADELERRVRAFNPWPGAFMDFDGTILKIHRAHVSPLPAGEGLGVRAVEAGKRMIEANQPAIGTRSGLLVLDEVQPAGKKSMSGKSFLAGARHWA
jgi:methionyl-tRNA formyltransferase